MTAKRSSTLGADQSNAAGDEWLAKLVADAQPGTAGNDDGLGFVVANPVTADGVVAHGTDAAPAAQVASSDRSAPSLGPDAFYAPAADAGVAGSAPPSGNGSSQTLADYLRDDNEFASNQADPAAPGPPATLQTLANYLTDGFWAAGEFGGGPRHFNLTNSGTGANNGVIRFNVTGFSGLAGAGTDTDGISAARQEMIRNALDMYSDVLGITFIEVTGQADDVDLYFKDNVFTSNGSERAFANSQKHSGSDNIDYSWVNITPGWDGGNTAIGSYAFQTAMHEIGHALGLGHQGLYNAGSGNPTYNDAYWQNDSWQATIMSYWDQIDNTFIDADYARLISPMSVDWIALNGIYGGMGYGVSNAFLGNTVWGFNTTIGASPSPPVSNTLNNAFSQISTLADTQAFTIVDGGGIDTLDFSGFSATQLINLAPSSASSTSPSVSNIGGLIGNMTIAQGTVIENAIGGSGADTFYGNTANNTLTGNGGLDTVIFNGNRSAFAFIESNNYTVTGAGQGTDTLNSIERFVFNDIALFDDAIGGTNTVDALYVGTSGNGNIQFNGDRDWFATSLTAGHRYVIDLHGSPSGAGTLSDPYLRLYGAAGTLRASDDDSGLGVESMLAVRTDTGGAFFVGAAGYNDVTLGSYTATLRDVGSGTSRFEDPNAELARFTPSGGGWTSDDRFPRELADVNGDGLADIVGFGHGGVFVSLASAGGHFASPTIELGYFGAGAGGWSSDDRYPRELADVTGDGLADIIGFGDGGVFVSRATGGGHFATATIETGYFTAGAGWISDDRYPREVADVNGDGLSDIVGFGDLGVYVALGTSGGHFAAATIETGYFTFGAGWSSNDRYPRMLADVDGDGRSDIVGFGESGVYVSLATGGGHFGPATIELGYFTPGAGWSSNDRYLREVADVNADGLADLVGFGEAGVYVALATGGGHFAAAAFELARYGAGAAGGGWSSDDIYHRELADVNGDHRADIVGFADTFVFTSPSHDFVLV